MRGLEAGGAASGIRNEELDNKFLVGRIDHNA